MHRALLALCLLLDEVNDAEEGGIREPLVVQDLQLVGGFNNFPEILIIFLKLSEFF